MHMVSVISDLYVISEYINFIYNIYDAVYMYNSLSPGDVCPMDPHLLLSWHGIVSGTVT